MTHEARPAADGDDRLDRALRSFAAIAADAGVAHIAREAIALAERVDEGRFYVACLGQFKRGKSSLLNALLGTRVLPVGIVPITAVPTVLRHGDTLRARVQLADAEWHDVDPAALDAYVSEEHNAENWRAVRAVEVFLPSPLLLGGLSLVDTPGVGSVYAGNTEATQAFVPHVDVALVVVGVDPPVTGDELALITEVGRQAPDIVVVLSKADRFTEPERAEAVAFTERVVSHRLGRPITRTFQVSAAEHLRLLDATGPQAASESVADAAQWDALTTTLLELQRSSGRVLARNAGARGATRVGAALTAVLTEQRAALTRPVAESERRLAALGRAVAEASQRALELGHLFAAEQERIGRTLAARRIEFLARVGPAAAEELDAAVDRLQRWWGPALRAEAFQTARAIGRASVEPWLADETTVAEAAYRETADRFVALANGFLDEMRRVGVEGLDALPGTITAEAGLRVRSRYFYRDLAPLVYGTPLRDLLDVLRSCGALRTSVRRDAAKYLNDLLAMNSTLVENDFDERVGESRRLLQAEIQEVLQATYRAVEGALGQARTAHAAGTDAVAAALARIDALRARLDDELANIR